MCDVADQEGADLSPARTQMTTGEKGVTTVVACTYEQDDAATVDTAEARLKPLRTDARQASRRAVHQHPVRAASKGATLGVPKIITGHGAQHLIGVHAFTLS
jgi:phosphoketolase